MIRAFLVCFLLSTGYGAIGQQDSTWVRYAGGMDFREGLYAEFDAFRYNRPSHPLAILRDDQGSRIDDLRKYSGKLFWQPDSGDRQPIDLDAMWGFCNNNVVFIRAGNGFFRIGLMGSIAHVLYEYSYRDWDPYMYPGGSVTRTAQGQYVLDMQSGRLMDFNASTMQELLARDELLSAEYNDIPPKKRKSEVLFLFLRRYNDRYPLYFPP